MLIISLIVVAVSSLLISAFIDAPLQNPGPVLFLVFVFTAGCMLANRAKHDNLNGWSTVLFLAIATIALFVKVINAPISVTWLCGLWIIAKIVTGNKDYWKLNLTPVTILGVLITSYGLSSTITGHTLNLLAPGIVLLCFGSKYTMYKRANEAVNSGWLIFATAIISIPIFALMGTVTQIPLYMPMGFVIGLGTLMALGFPRLNQNINKWK
ncbi:MAG: hypothetical protein ABIC04_02265 [Nanoarchaeota archaeon]